MTARNLTIITIALLATATFFVVNSIPVHHDIGWPLHVAERVLAGAELYVDVIEVHPPLIVGYAMIAVVLGKLPVLNSIVAYHLVTLLLVLWSLRLCARVLAEILAEYSDDFRQHALLAIAFLLLPLVGYSFGQEEHLMLTLVLPYALLVAGIAGSDEPDARTRTSIGVLAGIGFCMKPFYGPLWLLYGGYILWQRGLSSWRRAEVIAPGVVIVAYILFTLLLTPGYFTVASWAADVYFDYFPSSLHAIVFSLGTVATLVALLGHTLTESRGAFTHLRRVLALTLLASFVVVLLQRKGWSYHWYPVYALALLLIDICVLEWLRTRAALERGARGIALAAAVLALSLGAWRLGWSRSYWRELAGSPYHLPQLSNVVERFAEGGPIIALSTAMPVAFPLVNVTDIGWGSRFSCLWVLPGLYTDTRAIGDAYPYRDAAQRPALEQYLIDAMAEDIARSNPTLIIVDQAAPAGHMRGFRYIEYFARDPRLRALFSRYALIGEVGQYQIFKRLNPNV